MAPQSDRPIVPLRPRILRRLGRFVVGLAVVMAAVIGWRTSGPARIPVARAALANPALYNPNSPHWSHIDFADFGRTIKYLNKNDGRRQAVHEWYARHVDMVEVGMDTFVSNYDYLKPTVNIKDYNPTIKTFGYEYDSTVCQHQGCTHTSGAMPADRIPQSEDQFLHFSEDTVLEAYDLQNHLLATLHITGCPVGQAITASCRAQTYIWDDYRWLTNVQNSAWRTWYADHLLDELATDPFNSPYAVDGLFLDEHGPGFAVTLGFASQVKLLSGGGIREYGGLRPRNVSLEPENDLDRAYTDDVSSWLSYLRGRLDAAGKFAHINVAEYFMDPLSAQSSLAAKGAMTEHLNTPFDFAGSAGLYPLFLQDVRQITAAGGSVDLAGTMCDAIEPNLSQTQPTFSAGNYPTAVQRYSMFNLANYYLAKQSSNETGKVYLDTNLCVTDATTTADLDAQWLTAYEQDVGQPVGEPTVRQSGPNTCATTYNIYARQFTNALVLLRPRDSWWCNTYDDATAVTVPLGEPMQLLNPDGTRGVNITSVAIRNGEAVILFPSVDTVAPAAVTDVR